MPEPRILLVQDRPASLDYQAAQFQAEAKVRGVPLTIERFDLRRSPADLLDRLAGGSVWFDWMVTDLLYDGVDHDPLHSHGLRLLREIVARGLFRGYSPRVSVPSGIRAIAVCSVCVDHGAVLVPELQLELAMLGLKPAFFARGGDIAPLCRRIFDALAAEEDSGTSYRE